MNHVLQTAPDEQALSMSSLAAQPSYRQLIRSRRWVCSCLTLLMLGAYFSFILTLAYRPALLATPLSGAALTWGIVTGFGLFALTFLIVAAYVGWANRSFDPAVAQLRAGVQP